MNNVGNPASIYLLAGGPGSRRAHKDPLLAQAIASCGVAEPSIAYVGAASGDDTSFFKMIAGLMRICGAGEVELAPLAGRRIKPDKARSILEKADLVFISGGDVEEGMEVLEERGMMPFLRELHRGGSPSSGSRPGASCSRANGSSGTIPTTTRLRALFPAWDSRRFSAIRTRKMKDGKSFARCS